MARLGRARPQPPTIARARRPLHATITLPAWETVSEWPALAVETPDANIVLAPWETPSEWPDLQVSVATTIVLAPWETVSEWPALVVQTPVLPGDSMDGQPGQLEFNGFLLGRTTPYQWLELSGWSEHPDEVSQNVPDPSGHGSLPVRPILGERVVLYTSRILTTRDQIEAARDQVKRAMKIGRDETEFPLVINEFGTPRLAFGRGRRVAPGPLGKYTKLGLMPLVIEWVCADPRLYNLDRTGLNLALDTPTAAPNAGTTDTFPLIRIPGPVTNPTVENTTTGRKLVFDITLAGGERLVIDPHPHRRSIFLDDGSELTLALDSLVIAESVPLSALTLADGDNELVYSADSGGTGAPATVLYRDAWM